MGSSLKKVFCSLSLISLFLLTPALEAITQYSYTGQLYTDVQSPYTTSMNVQGYFTTASPLGNNLSDQDLSGSVLFYSFFDGLHTLDSTNSTISAMSVSTNNLGAINGWVINFQGGIIPNSDFIVTDSLQPIDEARYNNRSAHTFRLGTWTTSEVIVPEPGTYATLAGTLALVALIASKRRKAVI